MNRGAYLFILLLFVAAQSIATIRFSARNGKWHAISTWENNVLPQTGDTIIVRHYLNADGPVYLNQNVVTIESTGVLCIPYKVFMNNNSYLTNYGRMKFAGMDISFSKANNYGIVLCYNDFINLSGSGSEYNDLPPGYTEVGSGNFNCCTAPALKDESQFYACDWQEFMMAVQSISLNGKAKLCKNIIHENDRELIIYSEDRIEPSEIKFFNLAGAEIKLNVEYDGSYYQGVWQVNLKFDAGLIWPVFVLSPKGTCIIRP